MRSHLTKFQHPLDTSSYAKLKFNVYRAAHKLKGGKKKAQRSEVKYWQYMAISSPKHWIPLPISNQYTFTLLDVFKWIRNIGSNRGKKKKVKRKKRMARTERAGIFSIFEKRVRERKRKNCRKRKQLNKITLPFTRWKLC